ncbi:MAG: MarP family serine protease, partial [Citromicrobium sp.]|nr:MarP family serine protease [Citromicrobium sp.]
MGCRPVSNFNLVGAAQVGKSSLTGMRLLHRLDGALPVWPVDPLPRAGSVLVEIYTALASLEALPAHRGRKIRDFGLLDEALRAIGSDPTGTTGAVDDHSSDALLTAAWLLGSALSSSPQPNLAAAVRDSKVIAEVDAVAPGWMRSASERLAALWDTAGLHDVLKPFGPTAVAAVDAPDATLAESAVVGATSPSVVKVRGLASSCQKVLEGSGFVVAPNRVMSNAHVVAGSESVSIEVGGQSYEAGVVSYDPDADISILDVPNLPSAPLQFADGEAPSGTDGIVMGYPGGGDFTATPARVREIIELNGPDIYRTTTVTREVYTIRGTVKQGNSGGPM